MVFSDHGGLFLGAALQRWGLFAHTDSSLVSSRQVCGLPRAAMACVPIRFQGGRRAVAVLREASRPNRLFYSHRGQDAGGESRKSTFVQREEGCGKTLGMRASRLATWTWGRSHTRASHSRERDRNLFGNRPSPNRGAALAPVRALLCVIRYSLYFYGSVTGPPGVFLPKLYFFQSAVTNEVSLRRKVSV